MVSFRRQQSIDLMPMRTSPPIRPVMPTHLDELGDPRHFSSDDTTAAATSPVLPIVRWRGVLVDTARNYWPLWELRRLIRVLAKMNMNMIQFRVSDDQSFTVESSKVPGLGLPATEGGRVYSQSDIRALVRYANAHNVSIVPEINVPGRAAGWLNADVVVSCPRFACDTAWAVPMTLDAKTAVVAANVISEIVDVFDPPLIHLGGDELSISSRCFAEANARRQDRRAFEETLKKTLTDNGVRVPTIRWEESREYGNTYAHYWLTTPDDFRRAFVSRGLYFDKQVHDDAWAVYQRTSALERAGTRGIVAAPWELTPAQWSQTNVWGKLVAVSMAFRDPSMSTSQFRSSYGRTCATLIDGRLCPAFGRVVNDEWSRSFKARERERDRMICRRISGDRAAASRCSTKNCRRHVEMRPRVVYAFSYDGPIRGEQLTELSAVDTVELFAVVESDGAFERDAQRVMWRAAVEHARVDANRATTTQDLVSHVRRLREQNVVRDDDYVLIAVGVMEQSLRDNVERRVASTRTTLDRDPSTIVRFESDETTASRSIACSVKSLAVRFGWNAESVFEAATSSVTQVTGRGQQDASDDFAAPISPEDTPQVLWIVTHVADAGVRSQNVAKMQGMISELTVQHGYDAHRCVKLLRDMHVRLNHTYWHSQGFLLAGKLGHWCSMLDILRTCAADSYDYCVAIQDDIPWKPSYKPKLLGEIRDSAFTLPLTRRAKHASEGVLVIRGGAEARRVVAFVRQHGIYNPTDFQLRRFTEVVDRNMYIEGHLGHHSLIRNSKTIDIAAYNRHLDEGEDQAQLLLLST
jgi:hypothetical protein